MNQHPGLIGRKVGMTQIHTEEGNVVPCTVIECHSIVVSKRTKEKDGYDALVVGTGKQREKNSNKPLLGLFKKAGTIPLRTLKELRCSADYAAKFTLGQEIIPSAVFTEGQFVDVQGTSKGKGFQGVMKKYHFQGFNSSHGTHEYFRHGGSIGQRKTPGRTFPGMKMPGQMGNATVTVHNQKIVKVMDDKMLVLIEGGVPGSRNSMVIVRGAVRKFGGIPKPVEAAPTKTKGKA